MRILIHNDQLSNIVDQEISGNYGRTTAGAKHARIERICMPVAWYHITSTRNTLVVTEGAVAFTITLPPGNYTGALLTAQLKVLLDAGSPAVTAYTVTLSDVTGKLTIINAALATISLGFAANTPLATILGFPPVNSPANAVTVGSYPVQLNPSTITLCSKVFDGYQDDFKVSTKVLPISVTASPFQVMSIDYAAPIVMQWQGVGDSINRFHFFFIDAWGETIEWNNAQFQITLIV